MIDALSDRRPIAATFPDSSFGKIDVDDWGFGFNFGVLLEPSKHTRLGLAYRSKVDVELEGDLSTNQAALAAPAQGPMSRYRTRLLLSAYHELNPQWAVMADVTWTQWSKLDALVFAARHRTRSPTPSRCTGRTALRYRVGTSYKHDDNWTFRGGLAFDETPILQP